MKKLGVRAATGCILVAVWVAGKTAVAGNDGGPPPAGSAPTAPPMRATAGNSGPLAEISTSLHLTCARSVKGGAWCWGSNEHGQIGDGTNTDRSVPTPVSGLGSGVASIAAGDRMACVLMTVGSVKCWGLNDNGLLADGKTKNRNTPSEVTGLSSGATAITVNGDGSGWVLMGGGVRRWGTGSSGGLEDVTGLVSGISAIARGESHGCAIEATGGLRCWGSNLSGQLGDGTTERFRPDTVRVTGMPSAIAVACGGKHTCGITSAGELWCWGDNKGGQLGDGTTKNRYKPTKVIGIGGVTAVSTGYVHTCAVTSSGGVKCWGENYGYQLGNGTEISTKIPVQVTGLTSGITAVAAGSSNTCALTRAGEAWCWGSGSVGQLGDGAAESSSTPVKVVGTW